MTDAQRHLFPLPRIVEFKLTPHQRRVLDWVAFNEGKVAIFRLSKSSLRRLLTKKLIKVIAHSPARYMLTELGRMVRSHGRSKGRERPIWALATAGD